MSINLNHSQYGAQFKAFVDFAADHRRNEGTIVRLEGQGQGMPGPNGEPRVIVAKQGDGYGHVWRGDDSKAVNDNVRDLFLRSILAVCGVNAVEELPANVRAVMKDGDYGEGRPLTVRRITAVTRAIDANFQAEAATARNRITQQLSDRPGLAFVPNNMRAQKAQLLVELAKGDVDLLRLLTDERSNIAGRILSSDDGHFNDAAYVEERVEGLRRNIDEIRRAANGDRAVFSRFFNHLHRFGGEPLPAGQLESMVTAVRDLDLTMVEDCLHKDSYEGSFEAFCHLHKMVNSIVAGAGVLGDVDFDDDPLGHIETYLFVYGAISDRMEAADRQRLFTHMMTNRFEVDCAAAHKLQKGLWSNAGDPEALKAKIKNFAIGFTFCADHVCRRILKNSVEWDTKINPLKLKAKSTAADVRKVYMTIKDVLSEGEINDIPNENENPNVDDVPGEEADDDNVAVEQHAPPAFIDGLEQETKDDFMQRFYDEAVSRTVAGGRTKEDCDATLKAMFDTIGDDNDDRRFLAELLADGKPEFLAERGRLPSQVDAVAFARNVKAVLEQAKQCRANFPKQYGDIVADTILATLKMMERMVAADELEPVTADLCARLYDLAAELDTSDLMALPRYDAQFVKRLGEKLDNFQRQVDEKSDSAFPGNEDSPFMRTLKKNIVMNLSLLGAGSKAQRLSAAVEEYGIALGARYGKRELLDMIRPVLKKAPNGGQIDNL